MTLIKLKSGPDSRDLWFAKAGHGVKWQEARLACDSRLFAIQTAGLGAYLAPFPFLISLIANKRLAAVKD